MGLPEELKWDEYVDGSYRCKIDDEIQLFITPLSNDRQLVFVGNEVMCKVKYTYKEFYKGKKGFFNLYPEVSVKEAMDGFAVTKFYDNFGYFKEQAEKSYLERKEKEKWIGN